MYLFQSLQVHSPSDLCRIPTSFPPLKVPPRSSSFTLGTKPVSLGYIDLWRTVHFQTPANGKHLYKMGWLELVGGEGKINRAGNSRLCSWYHAQTSTPEETKDSLNYFSNSLQKLFVSLFSLFFLP